MGDPVPGPPSARRSLRVRLTLWVVLFNSVILGSAGAIFWFSQTAILDDAVQSGLLTRVLVIIVAIGTLASAISGWFVAGVAVAPLHELRRIASKLSPEVSARSLEAERGGATRELSGLVQELDVARTRFRERFEAQERFLLNASHEFKTPIAVLLTEAQTLDRSGLDEEGRRFVESVEQEMLTLGRLIESFLTLTRLQAEGRAANFRPSAVNELVMECVTATSPLATHHDVTLAPSLLWQHVEDVHGPAAVHGEPELLRTMVEHLIRNAIRLTPPGGVVEIATSSSADAVIVDVRDRGPRIPPEQLARIFDRFAAPDEESPAPHVRRRGLGLAIAMGIAELHGGTIVAGNRPGGGCEFRITLPHPSPRDVVVTEPCGR